MIGPNGNDSNVSRCRDHAKPLGHGLGRSPACFKLYGPFQAVITESFLTPPAIAP